MNDDLKDLLDSVRTLSAIEQGDIDLDLFGKHRRVFGKDATGVLIVPWPLRDYGLSREQATEVWVSIWSDPDALAAWVAYMEALRVKLNIPLPDPPKPEPDRPAPAPAATTKAARMKSLARRLLRR